MTQHIKAIIADDEKPLRDYLRSLLKEVWPELRVCGEAKNGQEVLELVQRYRPHIAFLDIKMPGLSGMEAAKAVAGACHLVFVTAYHQYAIEAFEHEAVDYLLKPVTAERLRATSDRLIRRIENQVAPSAELAAVAECLLTRLNDAEQPEYLHWIKAQQGSGVRLIAVEEIDYFKADEKYTLVMTREGEFLIKKSIKALSGSLDPQLFWQIHRGIIVNVSRIDQMSRSLTGRGVIRLKGRKDILTVSRRYVHLFKQM